MTLVGFVLTRCTTSVLSAGALPIVGTSLAGCSFAKRFTKSHSLAARFCAILRPLAWLVTSVHEVCGYHPPGQSLLAN